MASFPFQTGAEKKTVTFDMSLLSSPSRGIKRSIEDADLYLDDPVVGKRRRPEWVTADGLTSNSITYKVSAFTPTSLWAARGQTAWDSYSIYDAPEEEAAEVGTTVEATEHGLSSSITKSGLYTEISRTVSRLMEGSITRSELIERLQRVASQLKQWV
ncbi:hypothetical protein ARMGADRAFT_1009330 [Armillaria gallica]|uniref:Uncharacterized protein n=1 Tax=Armillaria gallica TaxID=47427 RepID=A0A2H3E0R4_ARMGA|nr:hypothetical protein ARMGADRAFT_1009330 [Armillaria gallica]